ATTAGSQLLRRFTMTAHEVVQAAATDTDERRRQKQDQVREPAVAAHQDRRAWSVGVIPAGIRLTGMELIDDGLLARASAGIDTDDVVGPGLVVPTADGVADVDFGTIGRAVIAAALADALVEDGTRGLHEAMVDAPLGDNHAPDDADQRSNAGEEED